MRRKWAATLAALALAACATTPQPYHPSPSPLSSIARLPGWDAEDHADAFAALQDTCRTLGHPPLAGVCGPARAAGRLGERDARAFLEAHLRAEPVEGVGLLTAYFSPLYEARFRPDDEFSAPVRRRPADPAASGPARPEIEQQPASDALAWMRPEDLFFLQIQGSGVLVFPEGRRAKAAFDGANGQPFVAIAVPMTARGLIAPGKASAGTIHDWLAAHRGPEADAVMRLNPRYIYFRLRPDDGREPRGSAGAPLVPGRSVAVDPAYHPWGELLWIDADAPTLAGARPAYQRLVAALDSGLAIKGEVRADLYLGRGSAAGEAAGRVRHRLRLWHLVAAERP